ncbi:predicted protein [Arabidopsis lyrata subsp. lyrata]|uniref:Predicted protein n=1 Tax=Arabidopsis lyrata subsp. lyrata TaxID=81972 RepID=D7MIH5_ARALL|nr:predicted protein [Arabidopsis lyrata subsp. lyrata]
MAIPLKLVAVVLFLHVIFSSVFVSAEMISSNSADCPSSSSCSVSIGTLKVGCLEISVTFNVLLLVCCFFRWVALRQDITHLGGMGSEIDPTSRWYGKVELIVI